MLANVRLFAGRQADEAKKQVRKYDRSTILKYMNVLSLYSTSLAV